MRPIRKSRGAFREQPAPLKWSTVMIGGELVPMAEFEQALLNGPKAWRVLVQLDSAGRVMPHAIVRDNERDTVTAFPVEKFDRLADCTGNPQQAATLRQWAAAFRAEQSGNVGRA